MIVDYLQLMTSGTTVENRVQEVSQISRSLKVLARDLEVPIVALSQLSRAVEQRHDKRPILSDLRESGSIEQDADLVMFVYRDEYYNPEETDSAGIAELILAKHRNGATGIEKLAFQKRYAKFADLASVRHDDDGLALALCDRVLVPLRARASRRRGVVARCSPMPSRGPRAIRGSVWQRTRALGARSAAPRRAARRLVLPAQATAAAYRLLVALACGPARRERQLAR